MSEPVHLTSDMASIDLDGHREHKVALTLTGPVTFGKAAPVEVICSCGATFKLATGPREPALP